MLSFARAQASIEWVVQNGSRVNPSVAADRYADYDIVFGCHEPAVFEADPGWQRVFGETLIVQVDRLEQGGLSWPIYLLQFRNGERLDVQFYPGDGPAFVAGDSLTLVLLDKTGLLPDVVPSEDSYVASRPTLEAYTALVNELWWCLLGTGKGLARGQLTTARGLFDGVVKPCLLTLAGWHASSRHGWSVNPGKYGRFLPKWLERSTWDKLAATYASDTPAELWILVFLTAALASELDDALRPALDIPGKTEDEAALVAYQRALQAEGKPTWS